MTAVKKFFTENGKLIWAVTAVVIFALLIRQCKKTDRAKTETESITDFLQDSLQYYKNELGQEVATKKALQGQSTSLSKKNASLQVLLSRQIDSTHQLKFLLKKFKSVGAAGNIITETKLQDVFIPFKKPVEHNFHRAWAKTNPFYTVSGHTDQNGTTLDNLYMPTLISFALGEKKAGFFQTKYSFDATSSNPYVKITGLDGATFSRPHKRLGLGFSVGYGVGGIYVGVGLNYNVIEF